MLKRIVLASLLVCGLGAAPSFAQNTVGLCYWGIVSGVNKCIQVSATNPLPVSATVTATATATATATLPTVAPGAGASLYENLSGGLFVQPIYGTQLVDASHGLPVSAASGAFVDGSIATLGTEADAAYSGSGSGTIIAILKWMGAQLVSILSAVQGAIPAGTAYIGHTSLDPCAYAVKTTVPIASAAGTSLLVAGVSVQKVYVCSLSLIAAAAAVVNVVEQAGVCTSVSSATAMIGSTTVANGMSLAANGGLTFGNGAGTIAVTATAADYVCLAQSGTTALAGSMTYVQQ